MEIKRKSPSMKITFMTSIGFLFALLFLTTPASAFEAGKTYDKTNYQEIKDILAPSILISVEKGDFSIKASKLDFQIKIKDDYQKLTEANEGKYDFDENGNLIDKSTGKPTGFIRGDPFDKIDTKDPKVAQKIMEKFYFNIRCRQGSNSSLGSVHWLGQTGGVERMIESRGVYFNYTNMPRGPLPNPNDFRSQSITYIIAPFDIRGTVSMGWDYNGTQESVNFSYVPMLRRVRRTSASARSDPFLGSDACTDDAYGYGGKNADMKLTYIGSKDLLAPYTTDKLMTASYFAPDGSFVRSWPELKAGFEIPGNPYASYNLASVVWVLRPLYIVEMFPKSDYYNYGRQILYIDQNQFQVYVKEMYDRAGVYWKKTIINYSAHMPSDGTDLMMSDFYCTQDDKTNHSTVSKVKSPYGPGEGSVNRPYEDVGPKTFTTSNILQLSK
jgi:hypothetical protein